MAIKLDMLRTFRTVAEKGTLLAASDALGRTPSAISMTLTQLEEDIGAPLFETDRKNRLTPLGLLVLEESGRAADAFQRSTDAIRRHALSTAGTVRIVAVPSATVTILPDAIASYRKLRPEVRLEISDVDSASVQRRIQMDEADIGILSAAEGGSGPGEVVMQDALGIICRGDGAIAGAVQDSSTPCEWELLRLESFISNPLCELVDNSDVKTLLANSALSARNTTALLSFIRAGLGATILPSSVVPEWADDLMFLQPENPKISRNLVKIRNPLHQLSPAAEAFWNILESTRN
jgi:DNA-binding transcriptional LysR family regulator